MMQGFFGRTRLQASLMAWLSLIVVAGLLFLQDGRLDRLALTGVEATHLNTALRWTSPSTIAQPPMTLAAADDGVATRDRGWTRVDLPAAQPVRKPFLRQYADYLTPDGSRIRPVQVVWYRVDMDGVPGGADGLHQIYLPRVSTAGSVAIYLDDRLVWQTRTHQLYTQIYAPVLIRLDTQPGAMKGSHRLYVRFAALDLGGHALSSVWVSHNEVLGRAFGLRTILQGDLLSFTWTAIRAFGVLALAIWSRRRRAADGPLYLNFAAAAWLLPALTVADNFADQPWPGEELSLWVLMGGSGLLLIAVIQFFGVATGCRLPVLERVARWLGILIVVGSGALLVYYHGRQSPSITAYSLIAFPAVAGVYFTLYTLLAVVSFRTWPSVTFVPVVFLCDVAVAHDLRQILHIGKGEDLFFLPFAVAASVLAYFLILVRAYVGSVVTAERASEQLQRALTAKEAELALSHRQLMQAQREQTLSEERQRMMREMHDGIGASLVSAMRFLQHGQKDQRAVVQVLEECIDDLKLSIDSLEPVAQDLLLLLSSLRFRLGARLQGSGLALHWDVADVPALPWLDAPSGMHILRILQEILTNILKHSGADLLRLSTAVADWDGRTGVVVGIEDNGRPFNPQNGPQLPPTRKGLGNVLSRTRLLHGHCRWQDLPQGNLFTLWLPLGPTL